MLYENISHIENKDIDNAKNQMDKLCDLDVYYALANSEKIAQMYLADFNDLQEQYNVTTIDIEENLPSSEYLKKLDEMKLSISNAKVEYLQRMKLLCDNTIQVETKINEQIDELNSEWIINQIKNAFTINTYYIRDNKIALIYNEVKNVMNENQITINICDENIKTLNNTIHEIEKL